MEKTREKLILDDGKLRTYLKFKLEFKLEEYLNLLTFFLKKKNLYKIQNKQSQIKS